MTKKSYGITVGILGLILLSFFLNWVYKPDYSRRGQFVFIGMVPCVVVKEDKSFRPRREITLISQNAIGQFYEITVPVELVTDLPVLKKNDAVQTQP